MTHPSHEIKKVYEAEISGIPNDTEINQFKRGLKIEDYITAPAEIKILCRKDKSSVAEITIHEGRNRQVRKMCDKIGHPVIKLMRIAMGELKIGTLQPGNWRYLTEEEIEYLKSI
jgi:23S rRNA pseudouridine2605 synthase